MRYHPSRPLRPGFDAPAGPSEPARDRASGHAVGSERKGSAGGGPMRPSPERRFVILAEGQFGPPRQDRPRRHPLRTRPGRRRARLDHRRPAGVNVVGLLPALRHPGRRDPRRGPRPMPGRPATLLIGIAPTGGKLPVDWRPTILAAIDAGLDVLLRPAHVPRRRPRVRRGGRGRWRADRRLPPAAGPDGDRGRPAARPGQARDPDRRHRLRDRQDVRRARAPTGRRRPPASAASSCRPARPG